AISTSPEAVQPRNELAEVGAALSGADLPSRLKIRLRTPKDALAEDLIAEAKLVRDFLYGSNTGLTWVPQLNNPEENKKIIEDLEERTRKLQLSIATIVLNDSKGEYTEALLRAVKVLAKAIEVPTGV